MPSFPSWNGFEQMFVPPKVFGCHRVAVLLLIGTGLLVGVVALPACSKKKRAVPKRPSPAEIASAEDVVRDFFKSVEQEDCDSMLSYYATGATKEDCEDFVRHWKGANMKFLGIRRSYVDGRNPKAIIVVTQVKKGTKVKESLVRVVHVGKGRWRVAL